MFTLKNGNLVLCGAVALVNPVNTEGVMGAGLALQIKEAYPESYAEYRKACMRGDLAPGKVLISRVTSRSKSLDTQMVIHFPTKRYWKDPSRLVYVQQGLPALREVLLREKPETVAIPALGCGLGNLPWNVVYPIIKEHLADLDETDIWIYPPQGRSV